MTDAQKRLVELDKRKAEVKRFFDDLTQATKAVAAEVGLNGYFQDPEGTVYKVIVPEGKFVYFDPISYVRTRRADEKRGDLSLKEAEDAGFVLPNR